MLAPGNSRSMIAAHGGRTEQQGFVAAAPVQDAIGEDMAALEIGRDLDFIDREKRHVEVARHRLDGRDPEPRLRRLDLLFAGDQRDGIRPDAVDDLVVDLARQQPQRQADHAGGMRQHALDREMRLAGIGRPEHGGDARAGSFVRWQATAEMTKEPCFKGFLELWRVREGCS